MIQIHKKNIFLMKNTSSSQTVFRQPANSEAQIDRATVPPEDLTLDPTQEFGGPDDSRYPVNDKPGNTKSDRSKDSASVTSQYESISEGSSTVDDDGNRTIHTSQHGLRAPQGLGTSPLQPPALGHASTPTQSQSGTPGNDNSAPSSPYTIPPWVFDEL